MVRRLRGINPAMVVSAVLLAGCGASSAIFPSPNTPAPSIQPNACDLLSDSQAADALAAPPPAAAAPAANASPTPTATITHIYSVETISGKPVGQCIWRSDSGAQIIALVYPNTQLTTTLAEYTVGAVQAGPAYIKNGDGRGFVSLQDGSGVLAFTLILDTDASTRTARLADLARAASGAPVPSFSPGAVPTAAATSSGAVAGGPGQVVQNQTASVTVKQTDQLQFSPNNVSVQAGQVLEWTNSGSVAHNVTFDAYPSISSDTMNGGDSFEVKFMLPGTYQFHCTFHPGMTGQVTVK